MYGGDKINEEPRITRDNKCIAMEEDQDPKRRGQCKRCWSIQNGHYSVCPSLLILTSGIDP